MANWVCKQDGVLFTPGAPCCPECQTRDAYEQGGDKALNVYDAVEVTEIASPGAAWATVCEAAAIAVHEHRQAWDVAVSADEARAVLMAGDAEVAERLGLVPGDPGAADSSTDPEPVTGSGVAEFEESGMSAGREQGGEDSDSVPGSETIDKASVEDTPDTDKAKSASKARQKDVSS